MGVLARLIEAGITDEVTDWYGCSGGCLIATLGAIGASPSFIKDIAEHFEMSRIVTPDPTLVAGFTEYWGINDSAALIEYYARVADIWCPGASNWTFADLERERPGSRLTFLATNISRGCQELFNLERTPNALIIREAMRASMAVPLFFTPYVNAAGEYLCDGAITEYYVWESIPNKENTLVIGCDDRSIMGRALTPSPIRSLGDYISRAFQIGQHYNTTTVPRYWITVNDTQSFLNFKITREERLDLFSAGEVAANRWMAFRRQAAAGGTGGNHPGYEGRSTLSSVRPSPDRTSDNRQSGIPLRPPYPSRDSQHGERPPARRWSL